VQKKALEYYRLLHSIALFLTSALTVFQALIWKKLGVYDKTVIQNTKRKNIEIKFLHKFPSKRWLRSGIDSWLKRTGARAVLTSFALCDPYRSDAAHKQLVTSQTSSCTEYLIPSDNIIVLVLHFSW